MEIYQGISSILNFWADGFWRALEKSLLRYFSFSLNFTQRTCRKSTYHPRVVVVILELENNHVLFKACVAAFHTFQVHARSKQLNSGDDIVQKEKTHQNNNGNYHLAYLSIFLRYSGKDITKIGKITKTKLRAS